MPKQKSVATQATDDESQGKTMADIEEEAKEAQAEADAGWADHKSAAEVGDDTTSGGEADNDKEDDDDQPADDVDTVKGGAAGDTVPGDDQPDEDDADIDALLADDAEPTAENLEKLKHAMKSLSGRGKKLKDQNDAEEARLAELARRRETEETQRAKPPGRTDADEAAELLAQFNLDDDEEKAFTQVQTDYPEIVKAMQAMSKRQAKQMVADLLPKIMQGQVRSLQTDNQAVVRMVHNSIIAAKHKAWQQDVKSKEFSEFVDNSPFKQGREYARILKEGTATEIVGMLDDYHESRKPKETPDLKPRSELDDKRKAKLAASQAVRHRTAGIPAHAQKVDKNDESAGWDDHKRRHST